MMETNNYGFTLVEILVVISIIGILIAISLFGIEGARQSARNGKRKADLQTIRSALEIYKKDNGQYPLFASEFLGWEVSYDGSWMVNLPVSYLQNKPVDPINNSIYTYRYSSCVAGSAGPTGMPNYKLEALLEGGQVGEKCPQCTGHTGGVGVSPGEIDTSNPNNQWTCVTNP